LALALEQLVPQLLESHGGREGSRPQQLDHLAVQTNAVVARATHAREVRRDDGDEPISIRRAVDHERLEAFVSIEVDVLTAARAGGNVGAERGQPPGERRSMLVRRDDDDRLALDETLLAVPRDDVDEEIGVAIHLDDMLAGGRVLDGLLPRRWRNSRHSPLLSGIALTLPPGQEAGNRWNY
jgi:hypothetical protein